MRVPMFDSVLSVDGEYDTGDADTGDMETAGPRRRVMRPVKPVYRVAAQPVRQPNRKVQRAAAGMGLATQMQVASGNESRSGCTLATAPTAGNVAVNQFSGQTQALHSFTCVAVDIELHFSNDAASATDTPAYLVFSNNPGFNGLSFHDGALRVSLKHPKKRIMLAQPMVIGPGTVLTLGTANLQGGTSTMNYSVELRYLTELDRRGERA